MALSPHPHLRSPRRLLRAAASLALATTLAVSVAGAALARGPQQVSVSTALDHATLPAGKTATHHLKVSLTGFDLSATGRRAPINVAIVVDKSGSMAGDKIAQAKAAARNAVDALRPDDIVSIVAYDSTVSVLVPATKVSDRHAIYRGIAMLSPGGSTALFAGTAKGAAEVRKFLDPSRVNRVVLLSDGQANVGPSSPSELGRLGTQLMREGISVTTVGLGLGYNEDLMVTLAEMSGGQHTFVEDARQLAALFREGFGAMTSICAKDLEVTLTFTPGFRPVRSLGRSAEIVGQRVTFRLSQLYAGSTDELLVAFDTPPGAASGPLAMMRQVEVASVAVRYRNLATDLDDRLDRAVAARLSTDPAAVEASKNTDVLVSVVAQTASEKTEMAMKLRDEGKIDQARDMLLDNDVYIQENFDAYKAPSLRDLGTSNRADMDNLAPERWNAQRKRMVKRQKKVREKGATYDFDADETF